MSEAKFTKGEWEVKSTSIHPARIKVKDKKGMQGRIIGDARCTDDAILIACAPEMYEEIMRDIETLKEFISTLKPYSTDWLFYNNELQRKEVILAKARGES